MSQWSEKISEAIPHTPYLSHGGTQRKEGAKGLVKLYPCGVRGKEEHLSETVSSTRYFFGSPILVILAKLNFLHPFHPFNASTKLAVSAKPRRNNGYFNIQINNFRKSSKKFIVDLLTRNVALNLSGALFFVGLGYSLKWWYKDQLFVILLKQNLPALQVLENESQPNVSWETSEALLNCEYQTWAPLIDRIDLYANHVRVKFKQPWQKHVYERFIGVFGEPAQINVCKQVTTQPAITNPFLCKAELCKEFSFSSKVQQGKLSDSKEIIVPASNIEDVKVAQRCDPEGVRGKQVVNRFPTYTPEQPIFPKRWFKLSPRNLSFLNQGLFSDRGTCEAKEGIKLLAKHYSEGNEKQRICRAPLLLSSEMKKPYGVSLCYPPTLPYKVQSRWITGNKESEGVIKLSYPLQLTNKLAGWQPSPNLLLLNSYRDEIPSKLENALQSYFPKKDSQLLFLSASFKKAIILPTTSFLLSKSIKPLLYSFVSDSRAAIASDPAYAKRNFVRALQEHPPHAGTKLASTAVLASDVPCEARRVHFSGENGKTPEGFYISDVRSRGKLVKDLLERGMQSKKELSGASKLDKRIPRRGKGLQSVHSSFILDDRGSAFDSDASLLCKSGGSDASLRLVKSWESATEKSIERKFLLPTKQTETYLKKSYLLETKKLLQNQLVSLINAFPINFVEKSEVIVKNPSASFTSEALSASDIEDVKVAQRCYPYGAFTSSMLEAGGIAFDRAKQEGLARQGTQAGSETEGSVSKTVKTSKSEGFIIVQNKVLQEVDRLAQLFANSTIVNDAHAVKTEGLDPLLLLNTLGFTFNNFSPLTNPPILLSNDKLVTSLGDVISNRVTNIFKSGVNINSISPQILNFSISCAKQSLLTSEALLAQRGRGILRPLFVPSQLLYSKLPLRPCKTEGFYISDIRSREVRRGKYVKDLLAKLYKRSVGGVFLRSSALHRRGIRKGCKQQKCVSFYFNPKSLNWVVFQQSTNCKFNSLLKKMVGETNQPMTTQSTHLIVEFLKEKKGRPLLNFARTSASELLTPSGLRSSTKGYKKLSRRLATSKGFYPAFDVPCEARRAFTSLDCFLLAKQRAFTPSGSEAEQEAKKQRLCVAKEAAPFTSAALLAKLNCLPLLCDNKNTPPGSERRSNCASKYEVRKNLANQGLAKQGLRSREIDSTISDVNKISFKLKETKLETLNNLNIVDKGINFDKNSRYMSGYVYPDIQSNFLKAHFDKWIVKNKNLMPWFSITSNQIVGILDKACLSDIEISSQKITSNTSKGFVMPASNIEDVKVAQRCDPEGVRDKQEVDRFSELLTPLLLSSKMKKPEGFILVEGLPCVSGWQRCTSKQGGTYRVDKLLASQPATQGTPVGLALRSWLNVMEEEKKLLENNQYSLHLKNIGNIEVPYNKFNHYLAKFPGFSDPRQFFTTLPQISCGNENLINTLHSKAALLAQRERGILTPISPLQGTSEATFISPVLASDRHGKEGYVNALTSKALGGSSVSQKASAPDPYGVKRHPSNASKELDKSEINKLFIQKNGCNSRKVAYSGIVVQRNKWTKDFQPSNDGTLLLLTPLGVKYSKPYGVSDAGMLDSKNLLDGPSKSSIWGTLFLGPENPLTNRLCHFFGQKQLSTLDTNSLQRDYLRQLGKEILTQSNSKGYTELSKFSSSERTKILSLSKKVNSFFFKKRKYSYLLEPKDQWHLLFQEQLCTALEDCKKYPSSTHLTSSEYAKQESRSFEETNTASLSSEYNEKFKASFGSGRIKISAPLVMARFPKKLVQSPYLTTYLLAQRGGNTRSNFVEEGGFTSEALPASCYKSKICTARQALTSAALLPHRAFTSSNCFANPLPLRGINASLVKEAEGLRSRQRYASKGLEAEKQEGVSPVTYFIPRYSEGVRGFTRAASDYSASDIEDVKVAQRCYPVGVRGIASQPATLVRNSINTVLISHYPLFTERFTEEINTVPCLNKNSLFYLFSPTSCLPCFASPKGSEASKAFTSSNCFSASDIEDVKALRGQQEAEKQSSCVAGQRNACNGSAATASNIEDVKALRGKEGAMNVRNNVLGIQNMCTSLLLQESPTLSYYNFWALLNQWVFLIALLFWIEQTLLDNVFPALFALEQILLSAAGIKTGGNNRTDGLRISTSGADETPKFHNLAGIDGLLGELSELVLFLRGQRGVASFGLDSGLNFWNKWNKKNSYGVLLTGSPGTGKTFLVRALANEAKVPVLILSASTLTTNKLNNNKPSWSIRHAFKRAKQLAPCILFIDEIDALGKSRGKIVTDINEIVADTNHASVHQKSTSVSNSSVGTSASLSPVGLAQQMFSYEQFGQNCSNFTSTLLNKWESPLQSTILQESNEINQNSLCQEKLVDLLKLAGPAEGLAKLAGIGISSLSNVQDYNRKGSELIDSSRSKYPSASDRAEQGGFNASLGKETKSDAIAQQQLPTLEKEMTRGKFGPLTQLLVSMDGVSSFSGVLIMGATNRPELLDPALTRPGRFEKIIRINKPSEQNRIEILQLYSKNLGVQQQIPWSYLATRTIGLTTADLAVAMNYSSLRAIIQGSVHTLETIEYGLNCITRL